MTGQTISHYEVLAKLGEGGMGVVYRARDTKLNREVAIKVLPEALTGDAARMERLRREAQVLAQLNHSNIAAIYGVEEAAGRYALVMELAEGETLAERIEGGAIPVEEALPLARQIAEALEAAHDKGVIHRDLKPANVKLTEEGQVKVLDFGLAKAAEETAPAGSPETSPTQTAAATRAGVILGTAAYMSPEQARGRPVDKRADIWSFGVVLYEMLTGRQIFGGETVSDSLASVLRAEIDFGALPADTPAPVRRILRRCLVRDRRMRLQAIGEARIGIEEHLADPTAAAAPEVPAPSAQRPWVAWLLAAAVVVLVCVVTVIQFRESPPAPAYAFAVDLPDGLAPLTFSLSPDGRHLAVSVQSSHPELRLWARSLDMLEARELPGTDGARYPFWSPDSRHIGFFAQRQLKRIALAGGPPQSLCDAEDGRGGSWGNDGMIVFSPSASSQIQRVSADGGEPVRVTKREEVAGTAVGRFPQLLPDGRHFLYLATRVDAAGIYLAPLGGEPPRRLLPDASNALYISEGGGDGGCILFVRENTLVAQPFDAGSLEFSGEVFPVVDQVGRGGNLNYYGFSTSTNGSLVYADRTGRNSQMTWFDRQGNQTATVGDPATLMSVSLAPDEKRAAVTMSDGFDKTDVWLVDLGRGVSSRSPSSPAGESWPIWSPDGGQVIVSSRRRGGAVQRLYRKDAGGTGDAKRLTALDDTQLTNEYGVDWSPDGRFVIYQTFTGGGDLWVLPMEGDRTPFPFFASEFREGWAQFSPDGRWIAYQSSKAGRWEVYVRPFPDADREYKVSTGGGTLPRWRGDGKELFYVSGEGSVMAAPIQTGESVEAGVPKPLFQVRLHTMSTGAPFPLYDVTADGQRFLVANRTEDAAAPSLKVFTNWRGVN